MITYTLNVTRSETLPLTDEQRRQLRGLRQEDYTAQPTNCLMVTLTEEQWRAVQKAVLETFK